MNSSTVKFVFMTTSSDVTFTLLFPSNIFFIPLRVSPCFLSFFISLIFFIFDLG